MKNKYFLFIFIKYLFVFIFFSGVSVYGQSEPILPLAPPTEEKSDIAKNNLKSIADQNSVDSSKVEKTDDELIDDTILVDIETSSYDELLFWCQRLKLEYSGSKSALQERLKKIYGVSEKSSNLHKQKAGDTEIKVESAEKTTYFKIEEIDEDYVRIVGNVMVVLDEGEGSEAANTHRISADYIIFNKKQKLMSAYGNVLYEKSSGNNSDFFKGNSLVFNIDNWEGVIYRGVSEKEKTSGSKDKEKKSTSGKKTKFYYSGEKLIKGKDDRIKMINGNISSSGDSFPVYRISAKKIWALGPGEWAIKNAILRVGEVPLIGIPFFLKLGDEFIFNPAIGKEDTVGYFLNTTYYFIGEGEKNESLESFNFLDPGNGSDDSKKWKDGLFLRYGKKPQFLINQEKNQKSEKEVLDLEASVEGEGDTDPSLGAQEEKENVKKDENKEEEKKEKEGESEGDKKNKNDLDKIEWKKKQQLRKENLKSDWENLKKSPQSYLKLMADIYSNIGQYIGLSGNFSGLKNISEFKFHGGIGLTYFGPADNIAASDKGLKIYPKYKMNEFDNTHSVAQNMDSSNLIKYNSMVLDHSYLFGILVPFRYGFNTNLTYNNSNNHINTKLNLELYSDSLYNNHFLQYRKETFDLEKVLGLKDEKEKHNDVKKIPELNWNMDNSFTGLNSMLPDSMKKIISSLSVNSLNLSFTFKQSTFDDTFLNYYGGDPTSLYHPKTVKKEFFVPSQMVLPNLNLSMRGTLFESKWDTKGILIKKATTKEEKSHIEGFLSPWEESLDESESESEVLADENIKINKLFDDIKISKLNISELFSHSLNYNISSLSFQLLGFFSHEEPQTPDYFHQFILGKNINSQSEKFSIIDFKLNSLRMIATGNASLSYTAAFLKDIFTVSDTLTFSSKYQHSFDIKDKANEEDEDFNGRDKRIDSLTHFLTMTDKDYRNTSISFSNQLNISVNPLKFYEPLKRSSILYSLSTKILDYKYDLKSEEVIPLHFTRGKWNNRDVLVHTLQGKLQFELFDEFQKLSINFKLPPKQATIEPKFDFKAGMFSNSLSFRFLKNFQDKVALESQSNLNSYGSGLLNLKDILAEDSANAGFGSWYIGNIINNSTFDFSKIILLENKIIWDQQHNELKSLRLSYRANLAKKNVVFSQDLSLKSENKIVIPSTANFKLKLWFVNFGFKASRERETFFDWSTFGWNKKADSSYSLRPESLTIGLFYDYNSPLYWKNRINFNFHPKLDINYNFLYPFKSNLEFSLKLGLNIKDFLKIEFSAISENKALYSYSKSALESIFFNQYDLNSDGFLSDSEKTVEYQSAIKPANFFTDLFNSFGSIKKRTDSPFNLKELNFTLTHYLGEWDLVFNYQASPDARKAGSGKLESSASWKRSFTIGVTWHAIDMIKSEINFDNKEGLTF